MGKVTLGVVLEAKQPEGFGRVRFRVMPDASTPAPRALLTDTVAPGSDVINDGATHVLLP